MNVCVCVCVHTCVYEWRGGKVIHNVDPCLDNSTTDLTATGVWISDPVCVGSQHWLAGHRHKLVHQLEGHQQDISSSRLRPSMIYD